MECETELIKTEESAHYELLRESQTQECWGDFRGKYVSVNRIWSGLMGKLFGFLGIFFSGGLIRELSGVDQKTWSSRQVLNVPAVPIKINSNFFHCFLNFLNFKPFFWGFWNFSFKFFFVQFLPQFSRHFPAIFLSSNSNIPSPLAFSSHLHLHLLFSVPQFTSYLKPINRQHLLFLF